MTKSDTSMCHCLGGSQGSSIITRPRQTSYIGFLKRSAEREAPDLGNPFDLLCDAKFLSCFQFIEINSSLVTLNNCLIGLN